MIRVSYDRWRAWEGLYRLSRPLHDRSDRSLPELQTQASHHQDCTVSNASTEIDRSIDNPPNPPSSTTHLNRQTNKSYHPNASKCNSTPGPPSLVQTCTARPTSSAKPAGPQAATNTLSSGVQAFTTCSRVVRALGRPGMMYEGCSAVVVVVVVITVFSDLLGGRISSTMVGWRIGVVFSVAGGEGGGERVSSRFCFPFVVCTRRVIRGWDSRVESSGLKPARWSF